MVDEMCERCGKHEACVEWSDGCKVCRACDTLVNYGSIFNKEVYDSQFNLTIDDGV